MINKVGNIRREIHRLLHTTYIGDLKKMNTHTRTITATAFVLGTIFQGHDVSAKVYAMVQAVESGYSKVKSLIKTWARRSADRRYLAEMPYYMLKDIGMEPHEAMNEANKPFWKA